MKLFYEREKSQNYIFQKQVACQPFLTKETKIINIEYNNITNIHINN